jgi:hypothetical protein
VHAIELELVEHVPAEQGLALYAAAAAAGCETLGEALLVQDPAPLSAEPAAGGRHCGGVEDREPRAPEGSGLV